MGYGFDILADGDPRRHPPDLPGRPRILFVTGSEDDYDPAKSLEVWSHFYPGSGDQPGLWPDQAPNQRKYFFSVPGFRHYPPGPTVSEWEGYWPLLRQFIGLIQRQ